MWNASRFCVSSLRRGHANLLCIVPILVYVLPKQVHSLKQKQGGLLSAAALGVATKGKKENKTFLIRSASMSSLCCSAEPYALLIKHSNL